MSPAGNSAPSHHPVPLAQRARRAGPPGSPAPRSRGATRSASSASAHDGRQTDFTRVHARPDGGALPGGTRGPGARVSRGTSGSGRTLSHVTEERAGGGASMRDRAGTSGLAAVASPGSGCLGSWCCTPSPSVGCAGRVLPLPAFLRHPSARCGRGGASCPLENLPGWHQRPATGRNRVRRGEKERGSRPLGLRTPSPQIPHPLYPDPQSPGPGFHTPNPQTPHPLSPDPQYSCPGPTPPISGSPVLWPRTPSSLGPWALTPRTSSPPALDPHPQSLDSQSSGPLHPNPRTPSPLGPRAQTPHLQSPNPQSYRLLAPAFSPWRSIRPGRKASSTLWDLGRGW